MILHGMCVSRLSRIPKAEVCFVESLTRLVDWRSPEDVVRALLALFNYELPISAGGGLTVSIRSLLVAVVILVVAVRLSRTAQRVLRGRVLSRVPIDAGLAYTLQRLVHYAIVAIGALLALRVGVGVDLTSLAVVVTALSVGIGLGLKEISSDVAAGFVLLFERPLRVGDRVKLNGGGLQIEGDVAGIDLRTTKIRTLDRMTVIVPNSKLTNEIYVNWTYRDGPVRVRVPIGVAYGSDVVAVRRALLDAASSVDAVLADPAPDVAFLGFGDSALDFALDAWTNEQKRAAWVRSEINFKIDETFREAGIEIPFPQQDVNIRTLPRAS
jgi:potassium efflux system protein